MASAYRPHQSMLRIGRFSAPNVVYSVTSCVEGREMRLVPDPYHPHVAEGRADIVVSCLRWLHWQRRIACHAYVVMPDHVHLVFALGNGQNLPSVMTSFGAFTGRSLNSLDQSGGRFWQKSFYDHVIRNPTDLQMKIDYVLANPVRKGFVLNPEDWPFSAAYPEWDLLDEERDYRL